MPGMTRTDYVEMLEEIYPDDGTVNDLIMKDRPLLALLERTKARGGRRYIHQPIRYTKPQGRSVTFATAQTNRTASDLEAFQVTYVSNYGYATVDGDVIDDAGENVELVAEALEFEFDGAVENLSDDMAVSMYRNTGGSRGTIGTVSTTLVTLANIEDVVNFELNMEIALSADDGADSGDALRDSGNTATITAINYDLGTLTTDTNWATQISGATAGDHLFAAGDFASKYAGLDAWVPATAPTSTAFYGVDRSVNTRLGGLRYTGTGMPIEEALMNAGARARRYGAKLDMGFMNPIDWNDLSKSLESKAKLIRETVRGSGDAARFGFDAIMMPTPAGTVALVSDPFCQKNVVWMLQSNTWKFYYSGSDFIRVIDDDDSKFMRETSNDGVEFRIKNRGNLVNSAPGHNIRVAI